MRIIVWLESTCFCFSSVLLWIFFFVYLNVLAIQYVASGISAHIKCVIILFLKSSHLQWVFLSLAFHFVDQFLLSCSSFWNFFELLLLVKKNIASMIRKLFTDFHCTRNKAERSGHPSGVATFDIKEKIYDLVVGGQSDTERHITCLRWFWTITLVCRRYRVCLQLTPNVIV